MPRVLTETDVADFRDRLCEAAERLFAEKGPDAVTMRQLSAELGVSPMTPYRYFEDKDDILAAVRTSGFTRFAEALEAARAVGTDARSRGEAVGEAYVRFALEHPHSYKLMFDLNRELGTTLVLVTHDRGIAAQCERRITIEAGRVAADS